MRNTLGRLTFSATDLSRYLACGHLTNLRRQVALGERTPPPQFEDPRTELLRERGIDHEKRLLATYVGAGLVVETITETDTPSGKDDRDAACARTVDAMRRGADVIYQGRLEEGRWSGYPDFLLRVDAPSALGAWSYEVVDAKLARIGQGRGAAAIAALLGPAAAGAGSGAGADAPRARRGRRPVGELPYRGARRVLPRRPPAFRGARGRAAGDPSGTGRAL